MCVLVRFKYLRIMLPMISDVSEADEALRLMKKAYTDVMRGLKLKCRKWGDDRSASAVIC